MNRKVWLLGIIFLIACDAWAQFPVRDVLYLKNGGLLRGVILENIPGKTVKIRTADGNIFVFSAAEVDHIDSTSSREQVDAASATDEMPYRYCHSVRAGFMVGSDQTALVAHYLGTVRLSKHVAVGLGVGWDNYVDAMLIPFYLETRLALQSGMSWPYLSWYAGRAAGKLRGYSKWDAGGFTGGVGIGWCLKALRGTEYTLELGYHYQQAKEFAHNTWMDTSSGYSVTYTSTRVVEGKYDCARITVGVTF